MPRPPTPTQRRYRGVPRAQMRTALRHLRNLLARDFKLLSGPLAHYPNQLFELEDRSACANAVNRLVILLVRLGPIPSRPGP